MQSLVFAIAISSVVIQLVMGDADLIFDSEGYNAGRYGPSPHQYYHSTDIASSLLLVNHWDPTKTDNASYIFLTFNSPVDDTRAGPLIYRADDLSLVYSAPQWSVVHNAHVGQFNGSDYLVFIEQSRVGNGPSTNCFLYDPTYTLAYNVSAHNVGNASMGTHECQLTVDGSAVIILTETIPFDLTIIGGPENGKILDNIVQEIDIATGELLWEWRASEHYDLLESYTEYKHGPGAYDYVHMNSAEKTAQGDFLISSRHTHTIKLIDQATGSIIWTFGGKNSDFTDISAGSATNFAWQHHARFNDAASTQLTLFDNHNISNTIGCAVNCTRGKHVELDHESGTARLVAEFYHPEQLISAFEGSFQQLGSGGAFLGWGANPTFTEHTASGECVLDVQFDVWSEKGYPVNYRAFKMNWRGYPTWDPEIAVVPAAADGEFTVYVSWNGATEVAHWQILGGDSEDEVTEPVIVAPRAGFETEIFLQCGLPFVRAAALDTDGQVLGMTSVVQLEGSGETANTP
ncbi:Arylsulfotransferase-domain-containing protein [Xylaria cf. heliscus]|nr:Arylsulfotransferase-domain-containing protein [Xylaria cf. heliscus]